MDSADYEAGKDLENRADIIGAEYAPPSKPCVGWPYLRIDSWYDRGRVNMRMTRPAILTPPGGLVAVTSSGATFEAAAQNLLREVQRHVG